MPNQKIVYDVAFETPGAETMVVTVTFAHAGDRTTLTIHTLFATAEMKREHEQQGFVEGTTSGLDQLAELARTVRLERGSTG